MTNPDFVKLAESMGCKALRCSNAQELPAMMKEFLEYDGSRPIVMECLVNKSEHVYPMVVAGKALHEQTVSGGGVAVSMRADGNLAAAPPATQGQAQQGMKIGPTSGSSCIAFTQPDQDLYTLLTEAAPSCPHVTIS